MNIKNVTIEDIDAVFRLYKIASDYQKAKKKLLFGQILKEKWLKEKLQKTNNGKC